VSVNFVSYFSRKMLLQCLPRRCKNLNRRRDSNPKANTIHLATDLFKGLQW